MFKCVLLESKPRYVQLEERALIKQNLALGMFTMLWSSSTDVTRHLVRCLEVKTRAYLGLPLIIFAQL